MGRCILSGIGICCGIICALLSTMAAADPLKIGHDGLDRVIWLEDHRAQNNAGKNGGKSAPAPLIIALHGYRHSTEAERLRDNTARLVWPELLALASRHGFVTLYPSAYRGQWSLFDGLPHDEQEDGNPIDDEGFLLRLASQMTAKGIADPSAIYLTGISDGAIMTYRLICLSNTPFAAAAPLIGTAFAAHLNDCTPNPPPALMHVHGTADHILPYDGWIFEGGREVSVLEVMEHWRRLHGCTAQTSQILENLDPNDGSRVEETTWTGCARDGTVALYKVIGGGHGVPDLDVTEPNDGPLINRDLDTMTALWAFFQANPRP